MTNIQQHISKLGKRARDRVTGIEGVMTSISFDLYGCVQVVINRGLNKDGTQIENWWYDIARFEIIDDTPVMQPPNYDAGPQAEGKQGAENKPAPRQ